MILHHDSSFFIEHSVRRKGIHHSRFPVSDTGQRDTTRKLVYEAERKTDRLAEAKVLLTSSVLIHYTTAAIIDYIVTQEEYTRLFGDTSLVIEFSKRRTKSRAWRDGRKGFISFALNPPHVHVLDVMHELAHTVTLRDDEPSHGDRFCDAFIRIAGLSPFTDTYAILQMHLERSNLWRHRNL